MIRAAYGMMTHSEQAIVIATEAFADGPPEDLVAYELGHLWDDLDTARRTAHPAGTWSMRCTDLAYRIARLTASTGNPTPWQQVPIPLIEDGIYQAIHRALGIEVGPDMEHIAEVRARIEDRRPRR